MGCSTYLGLGWRYQPLAPGHPTSICDIGVNSRITVHNMSHITFYMKNGHDKESIKDDNAITNSHTTNTQISIRQEKSHG